ncbi:MAG: tetratricopeptide repeat protein, partial [Trichormus sp.]
QKKWELALADFNKAIAINPQDADFYISRGNVYYDQKKWELALADYNKGIAINPQIAQAYHNRGLLYSETKDKQKAIEDLQQAAKLYYSQNNNAAYQDVMNILKDLQR